MIHRTVSPHCGYSGNRQVGGQVWRESKKEMLAVIRTRHEGGLTRVAEMVMGKCGQMCGIHRTVNQQDCLLTEMGICERRWGWGAVRLTLWVLAASS